MKKTQQSKMVQPKKRQNRRRKNNSKRSDNYSFLNFSNSGDILSQGIGKTRAAPVASGRALATSKPKFSTRSENTFVCHSEYIADIVQQIPFTVTEYPINPGMGNSFLWLSTVAPNYERYRFKRLRFRYEVLSSTNTTGKVFFVPNFNVQDPPPENKQEALSYEYAVGSQPWIQFGVDVPERFLKTYNEYFVRTQPLAINEDLKTYDTLALYICTEGSTAANLTVGEFWVDYEIELINPVGLQSNGGSNYLTLYNNSLSYTLYNPNLTTYYFGSNSQFPLGSSDAIKNDAIRVGGLPVNIYPNDTGNGSVLYFPNSFTGFLFLQFNVLNSAALSFADWPPVINYATILKMGGGSFSWTYYTDVLSSGNLYFSCSSFIQCSAGSQLDFTLMELANIGSQTGVVLTLTPAWLFLDPPSLTSLALKKADIVKKKFEEQMKNVIHIVPEDAL
jgi:hypothetical protein